MNLSDKHIILGSGSPRRKQLLEEMGWKIEVRVKNTPEEMPLHLQNGSIAAHLAEVKAAAFDGELDKNDLLITADTIVCLDNTIFNKPADEKEATEMLKTLSGKMHQVFTGVCLSSSKKRICFHVETKVWFTKLNDREINEYVSQYKPFDKAGAYGAQECLPEGMNPCSKEELEFIKHFTHPDYFQTSLAMRGKKPIPLIQRIEGSYFNVMGLPIVELRMQMKKMIST